MTVIQFKSEADRAFHAFTEARETALRTGERKDAELCRRLFSVYLEASQPKDKRWPREANTLRLLAPSELSRVK